MILASPPFWLLPATLLAALVYGLLTVVGERLRHTHARGLLGLAWAAHAVALHGLLSGPAHFGFAPAISVTAWLVVSAYILENQFFPQFKARWVMGVAGGFAVVLAWFFPGVPLSTPASAWLPLHWALGLSAYGMFGAAVAHAFLMSRAERDIRQAHDPRSGVPLLTLERLTFRFVLAGFILLSATLVAGFFFGDALYGHPQAHWRWSHKTIFALLSWLTFALLLWGRSRWGWRGRRAVRVLYIGAGLLLLSYAGSRFVMEVLLERMG